jgi:Secretion system C-terminal sorting domain
MKKLILAFIGVLCLIISVRSQDRIDPANYLYKVSVSDSMYKFEDNRFKKGWNWGSQIRKLDSALRMNFNHDGIYQSQTGYKSTNFQSFIMANRDIAHGDVMNAPVQAAAMYYEPSIYIYSDDRVDGADSTGAVFGFRIKNLAFDGVQQNNHAFTMRKSVLDSLSLGESLVLGDLWPGNQFKDLSTVSTSQIPASSTMSNCRALYITMRIKALEEINLLNKYSAVLRIKMPINLFAWDSTDSNSDKWDSVIVNHLQEDSFIKFDSIPAGGDANRHTIWSIRDTAENLGLARKLEKKTSDYDEFIVTADMLSTASLPDNNQDYITISAFIKFLEPILSYKSNFNPWFQNREGVDGVRKYYNYYNGPKIIDTNFRITNMGVEIDYLGGVDAAIDWVRIETPSFRELIRGKKDNLIMESYSTRMEYMDSLRPDLKVYRFFLQDEFWTIHWSANRYLNALLNWQGTTEGETYLGTNRFYHATGFRDLIYGNTLLTHPSNPKPYIRRTDKPAISNIDTVPPYDTTWVNKRVDIHSRLGISKGYWGRDDWVLDSNSSFIDKHDSLNSAYETALNRVPNLEDSLLWDSAKVENFHTLTYDYYLQGKGNYWWNTGTQLTYDRELYLRYYDNMSLLYNSRPWFANLWYYSKLEDDSTNSLFFDEIKPHTGEEIRLMNSSSLILGTKGMLIYLAYSNNKFTSVGFSSLGKYHDDPPTQNALPTDFNELIYGNSLGGDFIGNPDVYRLDYAGSEKSLDEMIDWNAIDSNLTGLTRDRVYIGRKSTRAEVYKTNIWIDAVEDELMSLKLRAWYAKGIQSWKSQHPMYEGNSNNRLEDYVNLDGIKVKKIWQPKLDSFYVKNKLTYENTDSTFFDITLLEDSITTGNGNEFNTVYIGVQNRRTDPLIFNFNDADTSLSVFLSSTNKEVQFYSSAEFDINVRSADSVPDLFGIPRDSTWWQDMWWKRFGAREIQIPIKRGPSGQGHYFKITELGLDSLEDIGWWYDDRFYHKIDTILLALDTLSLKLLPGQGKILKYEFINNDSVNNCFLWGLSNGLELSAIQTDSTVDDCCYDVYLINNQEIDLGTQNIIVSVPDVSNVNRLTLKLNGNSFIDKIYGSYHYVEVNRDISGDSILLGNLCFNNTFTNGTVQRSHFKLDVRLGSYYWNNPSQKFIGCDNKLSMEFSCDSVPKDCCEDLGQPSHTEYADTLIGDSPWERYPVCCNTYTFSSTFDSDCIYKITLEYENQVKLDLLDGSGSAIDFQTFDTLNICTKSHQCGSLNEGDSIPNDTRTVQMKFYGEDGSVICQKDVPMTLCCWYNIVKIIDPCPLCPKQSQEIWEEPVQRQGQNILLSVMPNPTSGNLSVILEFIEVETAEIGIFDIYGNKLFNLDAVGIQNNFEHIFDLSDYPSGNYYVRVRTREETITLPFILLK